MDAFFSVLLPKLMSLLKSMIKIISTNTFVFPLRKCFFFLIVGYIFKYFIFVIKKIIIYAHEEYFSKNTMAFSLFKENPNPKFIIFFIM